MKQNGKMKNEMMQLCSRLNDEGFKMALSLVGKVAQDRKMLRHEDLVRREVAAIAEKVKKLPDEERRSILLELIGKEAEAVSEEASEAVSEEASSHEHE